MKIAVIGTHGVGKTTLVHMLATYAIRNAKKVSIIEEVVRDCPFPINDKSTIDGAYWLVTEQISRELSSEARKQDLIVCDRSAIDPVMYLNSHNLNTDSENLFRFANFWMYSYETIILVTPEEYKDISSDGFRDTDKSFQLKVNDNFKKYIQELGEDLLCPTIYQIDSNEIFSNDIEVLLEKIAGDDEWMNVFRGL